MTTRRFLYALLAFVLSAVPCLAGTPTAQAQDQAGVSLRLVSQTAWTTAKDPILSITIAARNDGSAPFDDLAFGITIGRAVTSRNAYETTLTEGPGSSIVFFQAFPKKHELAPGEERFFSEDIDMSRIAGVTIDSAVYPLRLDLRSGLATIAVIDSAEIHLIQPPQEPLRLAWWTEIGAPSAFAPDGRLDDPAFEASIAEGGAIATQVEAFLRVAEDPEREVLVDLVFRPSTLEQLARMRDGYERADGTKVPADGAGARDAARLLDELGRLARDPGAEPSVMPFSAPLIPSLLATALAPDLTAQLVLGRHTMEATLGRQPVRQVIRPPQGALDDATVATIAARPITTILGNADTVERPEQPNAFAPLPTAGLTGTGGEEVSVLLPDPGVTRLLDDPVLREDPIRAAQVTLGELATIWRESPVPVPPTVRGVAVALDPGLPLGIWGPLTRRIADAPFLHPLTARQLAHQVFPVGDTTVLAAPSDASFSRPYADAIRDARRRVDGYESMIGSGSPVPERLRGNLLMAESGEYLADPIAGAAWIAQVDAVTSDLFERAAPDTSQIFTLTSREGTIPIRMSDPGDTPMTVELQFRSSRFTFPDGDRRTVELDGPNQIVNLHVVATGAGPGTIEVITRAPNNLPLHQQQLVVRVTAVNRIALVITGAAALVLAGLWSRRFVRRRT